VNAPAFVPAIRMGRQACGAGRGGGFRVHAVPAGTRQNDLTTASLCGEAPGRASAGWDVEYPAAVPINCPKCRAKLPQAPRPAMLCTQDYGGRHEQPVVVVGETPTKYRIRAANPVKLAGRHRWLHPGEVATVPRRAIRLRVDPQLSTPATQET
jgi:hypothetical protein